MMRPMPLMLVVVSAALAAPAPPNLDDDYNMVVPQKRAALVLDRLLIALQKALHDSPPGYERPDDGPRAVPLRIADNDMGAYYGAGAGGAAPAGDWLGPDDLRVAPLRVHKEDMTAPQRRGQGGGTPSVRGRVLRCYFNAVTCF